MNFSKAVCLAAIIGGTCYAQSPSNLGSAEAMKRQLFESAPASWKKLEEVHRRGETEFDSTDTSTSPDGSRNVRKFRKKYTLNGGLIKREKQEQRDNSPQRQNHIVQSANGAYVFMASSDRKGREDDFLLEFIQARDSFLSGALSANDEREVLTEVAPSCWIEGLALSEIFSSDRFVLHDVKTLESGLVQIDYDYKPAPSLGDILGKVFHANARVVLNPAKDWRIEGYHVEKDWGNTDAQVEYFEDSSTPGDVRRATYKKSGVVDGKATGGTLEKVFEYQRFKPREVPEGEFTLTHYGLPEPTQADLLVGAAPRSPLLWLTVATFLALLLIWSFRKLRRHQTAAN